MKNYDTLRAPRNRCLRSTPWFRGAVLAAAAGNAWGAGCPTVPTGSINLTATLTGNAYCEVVRQSGSTYFGNDTAACAINLASAMTPGQVMHGSSTLPGTNRPCTSPFPFGPSDDLPTTDYWRPTIAPGNMAPNKYTVDFTAGAATHSMTVWSITQINGTAQYGSYAPAQTIGPNSLSTVLQLYAVKGSMMGSTGFTALVSMQGTSTDPATSGYDATLHCDPVVCKPVDGGEFSLDGGPLLPMIAIHTGAARSVLTSPASPNYEYIIYGHSGDPIPGYMHDDPDAEMITREYVEGEYCVAVSDHDLINNLESDIVDEANRDGLLLEYPGSVLCTSEDSPIEDLSFRVGDSHRTAVISIRKDSPYDVNFVQFRVVPAGTSLPPTGEPLATPSLATNCGSDGVLLTVQTYAGINPESTRLFVDADLGALGLPAPSPFVDDGTAGDVVAGDGVFSLLVTVPAGIVPGHRRMAFTVRDNLGRSVSEYIHLDVASCISCPACPADYNQDGGIDGADVGAFFADWETGAACADVNLDGGVDGSDVSAFFDSWESGGAGC